VAVELGVEAGVLERERGVVGEGLGQIHLVGGELPTPRVGDAERAHHGAAQDQRHHAGRTEVGGHQPGLQVRGQRDAGLGQDVRGGHRLPLPHRLPGGAGPRGQHRADGERSVGDADRGDRHQSLGSRLHPEQDRAAGLQEPHDALDGALGHRGGIEGARELARQRRQRRAPLRLLPGRLRGAVDAHVTVDALDEAQQAVLRVGADRARESDEDRGGDHGPEAHVGEVLQEDLVGRDHHRGEDHVPVLERERGEDHQEDVDAHREAGHAARVAGRERGPLEEEHDGRVEERHSHAGSEDQALRSAARQVDPGGGRPVEREQEQVARPLRQVEHPTQHQEQHEEGRHAPEAHAVDASRVLEALAGDFTVDRGALGLHHGSIGLSLLPFVPRRHGHDRAASPASRTTSTPRPRESRYPRRRVRSGASGR